MDQTGELVKAMIEYNKGDVLRINHLLKVYAFAKAIGEMENLDAETQKILEIAAITHDIGIRNSERNYKKSTGAYQQIEGPPEARILLNDLGISSSIIERVCYLIAHHHTYLEHGDIDYQILIEADFLVNAHEDNMTREAILSVEKKVFKTKTGKEFLHNLFDSK
jgi:HD superfamily phosphodiesterase